MKTIINSYFIPVAIAINLIFSNSSFSQTLSHPKLTDTEIKQKLENLAHWKIINQQLCRNYETVNFIEAIEFVNSLVEPVEKAQHHPDILISYNKVTICLITHDVGGISEKDFNLAGIIDSYYSQLKQ